MRSMSNYLRSRPRASRSEPLFITDEGGPMSRSWFGTKLRILCQACGLPPESYTAHSLRIGAATSAAASSQVSTLKAMGRWRSNAYARYLRPGAQEVMMAQRK